MIESYKIKSNISASTNGEYIDTIFALVDKMSFTKVSKGMFLLFTKDHILDEIGLITDELGFSKENMHEICKRCDVSHAMYLVVVPSITTEGYQESEMSIRRFISEFDAELADFIVVTEKGKPEKKLKAYSTISNDFAIFDTNNSKIISLANSLKIVPADIRKENKTLRKEQIASINIEPNNNKTDSVILDTKCVLEEIFCKSSCSGMLEKIKKDIIKKISLQNKDSLKEVYTAASNEIKISSANEYAYLISKCRIDEKVCERVGYILMYNEKFLEVIVTGYDTSESIESSACIAIERAKKAGANRIVAFIERKKDAHPRKTDIEKYVQMYSIFKKSGITVEDFIVLTQDRYGSFYSKAKKEYINDLTLSNSFIRLECKNYQINLVRNVDVA